MSGTGINAPAITYAVNGKQYVAVLVGSRQPNNVIPQAPELKNTSTASMLFVFGLCPAAFLASHRCAFHAPVMSLRARCDLGQFLPPALQKKYRRNFVPRPDGPFSGTRGRDRLPPVRRLGGMTDAAARVHRWARRGGSVAGGGASAGASSSDS
jgi:hypothetical protein